MFKKSQEKSDSAETVFYYHYAGLTDTGMVRDHNEDAYKLPVGTDAETLAARGHLYVLADGMGGHQKGEVASAITIETVTEEYYASSRQINKKKPEKDVTNSLLKAIEKANEEVMAATQGGGTTVVAAVLYRDLLVAMNVGDSRVYLLRNNELHLLSRDHSLVTRLVEMGKITEEEAMVHPRRNVLYQALGQGSEVEVHVVQEQVQLDDIIILCSDGLWGEVGELNLKEVLSSTPNPLEAIEILVREANKRGGPDNITAIVIQVSDQEPPSNGYGSVSQSPPLYKLSDDDTQPSMTPVQPLHEKPGTLPETD